MYTNMKCCEEFKKMYGRMVEELGVCGVDRSHCGDAEGAFERLGCTVTECDEEVCLTGEGVKFGEILDGLREEDRPHFQRHMYYLRALRHLAATAGGDDDDDDASSGAELERLQGAFRDARRAWGQVPEDMDPEIGRLLRLYKGTRHAPPSPPSAGTKPPPPPIVPPSVDGGLVPGGMLGELAREISNEIVEEEEGDLSDTGELLGRVLQKVTGKIGSRIRSGELKQDQLFQEAMSMLGGLATSSSGLGGGDMGDVLLRALGDLQQKNNEPRTM
jgi:hypothetical protein